eukprot:15361863-Ditylum_brightwellii.AAC.1
MIPKLINGPEDIETVSASSPSSCGDFDYGHEHFHAEISEDTRPQGPSGKMDCDESDESEIMSIDRSVEDQNDTTHISSHMSDIELGASHLLSLKWRPPKRQLLPKRLAFHDDRKNFSTPHCFIRSDLIELYFADPEKRLVGLRCPFCSKVSSSDQKKSATLTLNSLDEIYGKVLRHPTKHLKQCENIPPELKDMIESLKKTSKTRGKKAVWKASAKRLGLED